MPQKLDDCVSGLMSDPNFKPRKGQDKKSAAFAVCNASLKKGTAIEVEVKEYMASEHKVNHFFTATDVVRLMQANEGSLPSEVELMRAGQFFNDMYGDFSITNEDLDHFVASFNAAIRGKGDDASDKTLPINCGHNREGEAAGWITGMKHDGDGVLKANVDWTDLGKDKIDKKLYKYISPEWYFDYVDPANGDNFRNVITGAGLTNVPLFKKLKPLTSSESSMLLWTVRESMKLEDVLAKDTKSLTQEEKDLIKASESKLTSEQKAKYPNIFTAAEMKKCEKCGKEIPASDWEEHMKKHEEKKAAETVEMQASEVAVLKEKAAKYEAMEKEQRKNNLLKELEPLTASEGKDAQLTPAQRDIALDLLVAMESSADSQKKFKEFLASLPASQRIAKEKGSDKDGDGLTASEQLDKLTKEFMATEEGKGLSYSVALKKVLDKHPNLATEYSKNTTVIRERKN